MVDDLQESEPCRGLDELGALDGMEMAVEPCHALVSRRGGVFLEHVLSGVAFGLFGGSLGFLFGFGGRITTIPEVYRLRRFMDGDRVWILLAELFDGFFRSTRGGEDGAGVMPFGIREGLSGILDDVETGGAGGEERGDIGEPLAPAIFHFDVVEDVVEVRGPRGVREAFLTVRLAVVSCDGHELADGELVEVVACLPDVRLMLAAFALSRT